MHETGLLIYISSLEMFSKEKTEYGVYAIQLMGLHLGIFLSKGVGISGKGPFVDKVKKKIKIK